MTSPGSRLLERIYNCDCITGARKYLEPESIQLIINDSPFGINEAKLDQHYGRKKTALIDGYVQAPDDYYRFSVDWLSEAKRVLKPNGAMYLVSGWTHNKDICNAIEECGLYVVDHII